MKQTEAERAVVGGGQQVSVKGEGGLANMPATSKEA